MLLSTNSTITDFIDTLLASIQEYFKAFVDAWNTFFNDDFFASDDTSGTDAL